MLNLNLNNLRQITVKASDLKIKSEKNISVGGVQIPMNATAFADIQKLVGLNKKTINHLNDTLEDVSGYALIQMIMKHLGERKNTQLKVVVDLDSNEVIRIVSVDTSVNAISLEGFEKLLEVIKQTSNKMVIYDPIVTDGGTKVSVQVKWDQEIPLLMKGETISLGKQFTWDMFSSLTVEQLVERLVCTNGMTGIVPVNPKAFNTENPQDFYAAMILELKDISRHQEFIKQYEKYVVAAMQSNLSVNEYNMVMHQVLNWNRDIEKIKPVMVDDWKQEYERRGINLLELNRGQLQNCPTTVNKWDAINLMTDLSSHVYQSHIDGRTKKETQKLAGQFLRRTADEDRMVYNVPVFKNRTKANLFTELELVD